MSRTYFPVSVIGGVAYAANSPPIHGDVRQIRWSHATDTGQLASVEVSVLPDQNDTGIGWQIYNRASANLATQFVVHPVQPGFAADGFDTGVDDYFPVALSGDRLRVKVTPADTGVVIDGKLYIWSSNP